MITREAEEESCRLGEITRLNAERYEEMFVADNTDRCNREITYLRVSITDRCNLRCLYCMSPRGVRLLDHADILSYEEILRVVEVSARLGINKVRLTGGEPLQIGRAHV